MTDSVLICGALLDGVSEQLRGRTEIVAMPGDPLADISVTAAVDFVMRADRVYRRPGQSAA